MPLFPLFADLHGREVLVVGGGEVATRKIQALLRAGARVLIYARELAPALQALAVEGRLHRLEGDAVDPQWIERAWLVVAATDDHALNRELAGIAAAAKRWINVVDDAELSSYQVPAVVDRDPITIAISSAGAAPMLARQLRERLEAEIDPSLGDLARLFARHRGRIRQRLPAMRERRDWFERMLTGDIPALLRAGDIDAAEHAFEAALAERGTRRVAGSVALIGCGDGDPGLLTLRALRLLNQADLILVGDGVAQAIIDIARRDATMQPLPTTDDLVELLSAHVQAGLHVVCLRPGSGFTDAGSRGLRNALSERGHACETLPGAVWPGD
ncbi:siroheme synthase [Thermomonas carbonis]|uniref:precorrin-2 dehydrogenase n=1 Tax=Thermomonas carbonis TaxID=1463158 RepID=A0A7G9SRA0_9GAMM|nr:NAD(P)-dependent oxidoreductase [Thermomonas carbonis]QNN70375.1 siroheme synthase [Thermomonas carbonis]GHB99600.1 siroheme synthase [Thermomonas carbonis]